MNGEGGRKYRGIREGGVAENTTFNVFSYGKDGAFEASPISDWYNFTPVQRYKTLDADEAEERKLSGFVWQKCSNQLRMLFPNKET